MNRSESDELLELYQTTQNRLRGRLLQLVESWGLDSDREKAMKGCIKSTSFDNEREFKQTLYHMTLERSMNGNGLG